MNNETACTMALLNNFFRDIFYIINPIFQIGYQLIVGTIGHTPCLEQINFNHNLTISHEVKISFSVHFYAFNDTN